MRRCDGDANVCGKQQHLGSQEHVTNSVHLRAWDSVRQRRVLAQQESQDLLAGDGEG